VNGTRERLPLDRADVDRALARPIDPAALPPGREGRQHHAHPDATLRMMRRYVRDNLQGCDLTVDTLARRHLVSVRHTHTLFAEAGTTPGGYIREQRLLAARARLSDPRYRDASIAEIAASVGFLEPRTFERAFRRQFGSTPGRWRRAQAAA
jgi:AraC-like DNA-binding protein